MPTVLDRSVDLEEPDRYLSVKQVATWLGVSEKTIYRMIWEEEIRAYWVRGRWRIKKNDVKEWIEKQSNRRKKGAS